jgi:hypothetical protein
MITEHGDVFSKNRNRTLKGYKDSAGFTRIRFQGKAYSIHRLVAELFVPNPFGKSFVRHIDGNKSNNRADNLIWCDRSEKGNKPHKYTSIRIDILQCAIDGINGDEESKIKFIEYYKNKPIKP